MEKKTQRKIILSLCGGTGAWEEPYRQQSDIYDVRIITLPENDVRIYQPPKDVYGILAAPPCTMFSFARTNAKKPRNLKEGMECVRACLDIIWKIMEIKQDTTKKTLPLKFWALENPYFGFLKNFLGKPAFIFDPWEFGDGYQKRTALWGNFNEPVKNPIPMTKEAKVKAKTNSYLHTMGNSTNRGKPPSIWAKKDLIKFDWDKQAKRSITPAGFAKAFFESNQ